MGICRHASQVHEVACANVALPRAEGEVRPLDRVEECRRAADSVERVGKHGVAFELADVKRGLEVGDDHAHEIGEHVLRVLELGAEQVARIAGDVRQHERAAIGSRQARSGRDLIGHRNDPSASGGRVCAR